MKILFRGKRIDNGEEVKGFYSMEPMGEMPDCHYIMTPETMDNYEVDPASVEIVTPMYRAAGAMYEALKKLREEAEQMRDGDRCDHSVGICWCDYFKTLGMVDDALALAEGGE